MPLYEQVCKEGATTEDYQMAMFAVVLFLIHHFLVGWTWQ